MALSQEQQLIELITRAKRVLLVGKEGYSIDIIASITALASFFKKLNKECEAVIPGLNPSTLPAFLSREHDIRSVLGPLRAFEIALNVSRTPMKEITYDIRDGALIVQVVPEHGEWAPTDMTFKHGTDRYDLIIAVGAADMASLGTLFSEHADFIYRTPVINIDTNITNEHWGQLNLVDLTAVSISELVYGICERWNRHLIDEPIATALLAGMIANTQSFRTQNVTPKTLATASQLIALGARREEIVHGLWRTRSVPTLKLWGKALSRLEMDRELGLVWSSLTHQDFVEVGALDTALEGIVSELMMYAPEAKVIILIHEENVTVHAAPPYSAQELTRAFGARGTRERATFTIPAAQALTHDIIEKIRNAMKSIK